jgi:hypothetical protein
MLLAGLAMLLSRRFADWMHGHFFTDPNAVGLNPSRERVLRIALAPTLLVVGLLLVIGGLGELF